MFNNFYYYYFLNVPNYSYAQEFIYGDTIRKFGD